MKQLFDSDEEAPETTQFERPEFEGEKGNELLQMQKNFKNDSRFKFDESFIEKDKPVKERRKKRRAELEALGEEGQIDVEGEKSLAMKVLSGIVPADEVFTKPQAVKGQIKRFDPSKMGAQEKASE